MPSDQAHTTGDPVRITGVAAVGVPVSDQDRALEFYVGILGLEKRVDASMPGGGRWIMLAPPGVGRTTLALVEAHEGVPAGVESGIRLATADAAAAHARLSTSGVEVDEILRWPGVPAMFAFRDQDGNGLELIEAAEEPGR